ncbi:hypothetical protein PVAND_012808 [Polypedilum vanderplanki]|uniref:BTB domain-containing protein n=1 Tax=Polypedilum vanderplanki TaxID=319348 RepID=A0A9J6CPK9_POLVA|nr:hypothetical protein PVAND_012808 [Polypedilum vanderplanki]
MKVEFLEVDIPCDFFIDSEDRKFTKISKTISRTFHSHYGDIEFAIITSNLSNTHTLTIRMTHFNETNLKWDKANLQITFKYPEEKSGISKFVDVNKKHIFEKLDVENFVKYNNKLPNKILFLLIIVPVTDENNDYKEHLRKLVYDEFLSDISIQVEDKTVNGHKAILARSPVFHRMISAMESPDEVLILNGISHETFINLMQYLYLDETENYNSIKLLLAAHHFEVISLFEECKYSIISEINVTNFTDIFFASIETNNDELKAAARSFIIKNYEELKKSEQWKMLSDKKEALLQIIDMILTG